MSNPIIKIHDALTNEIIEREMTAAEFEQHKADQAAFVVERAETEAKATAKSALLAKLGITADEAKLLLS
jgi:hypothetical protein